MYMAHVLLFLKWEKKWKAISKSQALSLEGGSWRRMQGEYILIRSSRTKQETTYCNKAPELQKQGQRHSFIQQVFTESSSHTSCHVWTKQSPSQPSGRWGPIQANRQYVKWTRMCYVGWCKVLWELGEIRGSESWGGTTLFWKGNWEDLPKDVHLCRDLRNRNSQGSGWDKSMEAGLGLASSKSSMSKENERRGWTGLGPDLVRLYGHT